MTNTIAQLWNGTLVPYRYSGQNNPEMKQLEALIQRNMGKLDDKLNEDQRSLLKKYSDCILEYTAISNEQAFCDGFCLGTRIAAEALTGAE